MSSTKQLVVFEFPELENTDFLNEPNDLRLLGLETQHPLCAVNGFLFSGEWRYVVGTGLLFPNNPNNIPSSRVSKKLVFRRCIQIPMQYREQLSSLPQVSYSKTSKSNNSISLLTLGSRLPCRIVHP
ncbi:hypothetical protein GEMRC1_008617 [Eukaryota sp. GEM-RC1]